MDGYPDSCGESGSGAFLYVRILRNRLGSLGDGGHHHRRRSLVCLDAPARARVTGIFEVLYGEGTYQNNFYLCKCLTTSMGCP